MHIELARPGLDRATAIAASGFSQPATDTLRRDVVGHLVGGDLVYVFRSHTGQEVGFAIFNVWDDILYLSGIIMDQAHQRRENLHEVVALLRQEHAPGVRYLALRTQSLRMWVAASRLCHPWYPQAHNGLDVPGHLAAIGATVAERLRSTFPLHRGCYDGQSLYGEKPEHHDDELQRWWDGHLDFDGGDALICLGQLIG